MILRSAPTSQPRRAWACSLPALIRCPSLLDDPIAATPQQLRLCLVFGRRAATTRYATPAATWATEQSEKRGSAGSGRSSPTLLCTRDLVGRENPSPV